MNSPTFSPSGGSRLDSITNILTNAATWVSIITFGTLPILFLPGVFVSLGYAKMFVVTVGICLSLVLFAFVFLSEGVMKFRPSVGLISMWGVAAAALVSAGLSGDIYDAFIGNSFGMQTAAALLVMALAGTVASALGVNKSSAIKLYVVLCVSALVLGLFHLLRFIFGVDFLSFNLFVNATSSPIGGWNNIAIFFGLVIIIAMIAIEQLPLSKWGKALFLGVSGIALLMLAVVNFFAVWLILGFISLAVLMFTIIKKRLSRTPELVQSNNQQTAIGVGLALVVFSTCVLFIIGGSVIGGLVNNATGVNFIEVRPSLGATLDITRAVYGENILTGIGTNKFGDAWNLYKDQSINQTNFWNTDFQSGSNYALTMAVEMGILGVVAWLVFLGWFLYTGLRYIFANTVSDPIWNFVVTSSFVAALYLWFSGFIYTPGTTIIMLAAVCSGVFFGAQSVASNKRALQISVLDNRKLSFLLVGGVMVIIVGSISVLYFLGQHFASLHNFSSAVNELVQGGNIEVAEDKIVSAYQQFSNDVFAREIASYQLAKMQALLNVAEPTQSQQQQFQSSMIDGVNAARLATSEDETDYRNWQLLGNIYTFMARVGVEGSVDLANEAYANARKYNPNNPEIPLLEAQLALVTDDVEGARAKALEALQMKSNYTAAIDFITNIEISQGNLDEAVAAAGASISLDPRNPARYYQLGLLLAESGDHQNAVNAFSEAILLNPSYANALYFRAVSYLQLEENSRAIADLETVRDLSPDNTGIQEIIDAVKAGNIDLGAAPTEITDLSDGQIVEEDSTVSTNESPDTDLVSTVNTVPEEGEDS